MFPEVDKEVLRVVLEANNGHMENTVEALLAMTTESVAPSEHSTPAVCNLRPFRS